MVKSVLNVSLAIKVLKKLDLYAYSFQKWVHIEEILMSFLIKDEKLLEKYNEIWEKEACIQWKISKN